MLPLPPIEFATAEEEAKIRKVFPLFVHPYIKVGEKKWLMSTSFTDDPSLYNFKPGPDDIFVTSLPRSGTTLTQELIWLLANDLNFDLAKKKNLMERYAFLDWQVDDKGSETQDESTGATNKIHIVKTGVKNVNAMSPPRFIKSHMPFDLVPNVLDSGCKVVYVARNPKDVFVSGYLYQKDVKYFSFNGTLEEYCDLEMAGLKIYSPYWSHVKEAWNYRHRENVLFLFFEDLIMDMPNCIKRGAKFFGKEYNDQQIAQLMEHLRFENFQKNSMVNESLESGIEKDRENSTIFVRKGKIFAWKEYFTPELELKVNRWINENLKDTDITFPHGNIL